jgi:hypothetical protein
MRITERIAHIENHQASGGGDTLRTAIAAALGHRIPTEGGTAAAVIDLSNPAPPPKRRRRRAPAGMPVLRAVASEDGRTLAAYCCWCRRDHFHGRHGAIEDCGPDCPCKLHGDLHRYHACTCPPGSGDGHRNAHCRGDTPFSERGYWIEEVRP